MFYTIKHKLHGDDLGALIEAESKEKALRILFAKGNFGEENQTFLLNIEEFNSIEIPLSNIKYATISNNKRRKKNESLIIQWWKGWGEAL
jgi:hypothetical protein